MTKKGKMLLASGLVVAGVIGLAGPVRAQEASTSRSAGPGAGIGVGASQFVSGLTGAQVVYDQSIWHLEGLLGFFSHRDGTPNAPRVTSYSVGVSGWYHFHVGASSDFSLGGGIGFRSTSGGGASALATVFEPGIEARVFVTPNVAVHGRGGLAMAFGDDTDGVQTQVSLGAELQAAFGFTYFFR